MNETFEILELEHEGGRPVVLPALTIRVQPFVVLDRFDFKGTTVPAMHDGIIERIARLVAASRVSGDPIDSIRLVGHTDPAGSASFNLGFGKLRAQAVEARLLAALAGLGPIPAGTLNIVAQSLGESRPVGSNATPTGRALNRRVQVFFANTCQSFFAQYDLRFLPGDPVFGIPAHPNLDTVQRAQRTVDVEAVVPELLARRDRRASEALAGRAVPARPLPAGALRDSASRLSTGQLALFEEYFSDGRGGIDFDGYRVCFERFANGELRSPIAADRALGIGEPDGGFFFLFAEFAFLCVDSGIDTAPWTQALRSLVMAQEIFMHVYRPSPVSPPPAANAPLPACPRDAQGRVRARRGLDSFKNIRFRPTGASVVVGAGQSSPARKAVLAARYAGFDIAALRRAARDNMRRAQCMP